MIGNLVYINTSRMKKDGKKDEKTTEAGTLSPQFGTYQSGDVASNGLNVTVAYSAKYDAQQLAYQSAYVAFGVPLNGYALPASKTAGYVKNSALPTLNGLNMAGDSMGETESSDEIDGVSEADADGAWDDNEAWEEETTEDTAVDNEESQVEESTDDVSAEETSSIADANESMRLLTIGSSKICEGVYFYHKDHLGSSSIITNENGEVTQRIEYLPTGETFIEQQDTSCVSPHKFNGRSALRDAFRAKRGKKELDEETDLYYYGARYYDPRLSLWLGTDPMQGKYPGISTYCYTVGNPVKFIDPDGREKLQGLNKRRDRLLWTDYNSFIDDPNTIHIWGHGTGTGIYLNNVFYDSAKSINNFLNENSTVWKSRSNNPVLIVLHSCYDASFAQKLSNNPIFKDVLVVGPTDKIRVEGLEVNDTNPILLESYVVNKGKWIGYRNGKYERSWDSYEKPGSLEPYKYSDAKKDFDKIMDKYGIKTSIENIIKNKYHAKDF